MHDYSQKVYFNRYCNKIKNSTQDYDQLNRNRAMKRRRTHRKIKPYILEKALKQDPMILFLKEVSPDEKENVPAICRVASRIRFFYGWSNAVFLSRCVEESTKSTGKTAQDG